MRSKPTVNPASRRARRSAPTVAFVAVALSCLASASATDARARPAAPRLRAHAAIIGGRLAPIGQLSSVADIIDIQGNDAGQCTGTVVAPTLVLTAAHCAVNMRTGKVNRAAGYRVLTGTVSGAGAEGQVSAVTGVLVYESFRRRSDDGDAALLVLATPTAAPAITLASATQAAQAVPGVVATVAGWGDARFDQRKLTERLRSADTVIQRPRWCSHNAPPFFARSELCAIDPPRFATGACHGDSGGPLLAPVGAETEFVVIGVTVHGYGPCSTRLPTVYTRADVLKPWVQTWIDAYAATPPAGAAPESTTGTTMPVAPAPVSP